MRVYGGGGKTKQPYHTHTHTNKPFQSMTKIIEHRALVRVSEGGQVLIAYQCCVSNLIFVIYYYFSVFLKNLKLKEMSINSDFLKENSEFNNLQTPFPVISKPQRAYGFHERSSKEPSIWGGPIGPSSCKQHLSNITTCYYHPFSFFFCLSILGPGVTLPGTA